MYAERPTARAIVHLHCTCAVAISCLFHEDTRNVLPALTAYHVMRVGRLPLVPYFRPGDRALAEAVRREAREHHAALLLEGRRTLPLDADRIADLERHFPN